MKTTPLFRARPKDGPAWLRFGHDHSEAFVRRELQDEFMSLLNHRAPRETIGLLAGRVCQDGTGTYTIVDAVEDAREDEIDSTAGSVRISGSGHANVRKRLESKFPSLDIIGWWHTHPCYTAAFSGEDLREQSTWTSESSVGIVVSGLPNEEPLGVYMGPNAVPLSPRRFEEFFRPALSARQAKSETSTTPVVRPAIDSPPRNTLLKSRLKRNWLIFATGILLVANLVTAAMFLRLSNRLIVLEGTIELLQRADSEQPTDQQPSLPAGPIMPENSTDANSANAIHEPAPRAKKSSPVTVKSAKPRTDPKLRPTPEKQRPPIKRPNPELKTSVTPETPKKPN